MVAKIPNPVHPGGGPLPKKKVNEIRSGGAFLEGGQDYFLDLFVLVWPSSRSAQLKQILGPLAFGHTSPLPCAHILLNFYDVLVMAIDEPVLREQVEKARTRMEHDSSVPVQRRLNFEMSVKNLYQSFTDRERVPKIQGLVNECMTFLDDELSVITGPYDELLSLNEVIEQELILFVTLNVNKNTEPVRALGKMLLQNLQLVVGKRYESEEQRRRTNRPMFSVVLDEFAPFGYRNFAQILQTAAAPTPLFCSRCRVCRNLCRLAEALRKTSPRRQTQP